MANSHGAQIGIESKIEYHRALENLGTYYESWKRTALNWRQSGLNEDEVEKRLQKQFNIQWAWADSIATEASQLLSQLTTAKQNNISRLTEQIKAKTQKAKQTHRFLEKELKSVLKKGFKTQQDKDKFGRYLLGLKSKILKIGALQRDLKNLTRQTRLKVCFGSKKLFNAQHHLGENDYTMREEWLADWRKARAGRFYCVGKAQLGGGTMCRVFPTKDPGKFRLEIQLPRCLQDKWGEKLTIEFEVSDREGRTRQSDLHYALSTNRPITTQVFRREHKDDQWYVHLTTYVPEIPLVHTKKNGVIGIDFNKDDLALARVKPDGNLKWCKTLPYQWKGLTTGQRDAQMRDLVAEIVTLAEQEGCAIAIESLDFTKKKARMSEASKVYNEMLSNLSTALFKSSIISRCQRRGVELIQVNPAFTSIIGMIKFMSHYGLNSGTSAAMTIARRAMRLSERPPQCLLRPEDLGEHPWRVWRRVSLFIKKHRIRRSQLFHWTKTLEVLLTQSIASRLSTGRDHFPSLPVASETGQSTNPHQSPMGEVSQSVQLCLPL